MRMAAIPYLLTLPNEILEKIASYLDSESLAAFADVHPNIRDVCRHFVQNIKFSTPSEFVLNFCHFNHHRIRKLDLSNCYAPVHVLVALIFKCDNLVELNLIHTRLTVHTISKLWKSLRKLEIIHLAVCQNEKPTSTFPICIPNFTIRRIYIEIAPSAGTFNLAASFINYCPNVRYLHVMTVGDKRAMPKVFHTRYYQGKINFPMSTTIVSTDLCHVTEVIHFLNEFFREPVFRTREIMNTHCCVDVEGYSNIYSQGDTKGPECNLDFVDLLSSWNVRIELQKHPKFELRCPYGSPTGLVVSCMPIGLEISFYKLRNLLTSSLVELNLENCHWKFPESAWCTLVKAAPSLESLAIPSCYIPYSVKQEIKTDASTSSKRVRIAPSINSSNCALITALSRLKLRQFHISGSTCIGCKGTGELLASEIRPSLGKLESLKFLESFTIVDANISASFIHDLSNSKLKTIRLCNVGNPSKCEYIPGLKSFIKACISLENFKLEHSHLPLDSVLLWDALVEGSRLKQLCLSSKSREAIEFNRIKEQLLTLKRRLNILHLHMENVHNRKIIEANIVSLLKIKRHRSYNGVGLCLLTDCTSLSEAYQVTYPQPGRTLCSVNNFIGCIKPTGWEFF